MAKHSKNAPLKIFMGIPSGGGWAPEFGMSLLAMGMRMPRSIELVSQNAKGSMLPKNRQDLLKAALKNKCTHILFMDDDMSFPSKALGWLLNADKEFIAAAGSTKDPENPRAAAVGFDGKDLDVYNMAPVEEVRSVGLAFALIKLDRMVNILPPHFMMEWVPQVQDYCGEDVYFCAKWAEAGGRIWVHRELSQQMGHMGQYKYKLKRSNENGGKAG